MNSKRRKNPKLDALAPVAKEKRPIPKKCPEAVEQAFRNWMKQVFGIEDRDLQDKLLGQAVGAVPDFMGKEMKSFDHVTAALHGIGPADELEGMLAVQMVATHNMAMECLKRAALPNQIDLGVEVNVNRSTKLMRTFASLTEALNRYRGKGEQKMTVEHVHVYQGGQAIVGQVSQTTLRSVRRLPGVTIERE
jgi:hypothetical protein